jgi:hypothetical protein
MNPLSVGNGAFAFTVDATGLQSFPEHYMNGIPLGTQSEWGWHSFANPQGYKRSETEVLFDVEERKVPYAVQFDQPGRNQDASNHFRSNPHRLHLGIVGFDMELADGSPVKPEDLSDIDQQLNLWEGRITSNFSVEGVPVTVETVCHPERDLIAFSVRSELLASGRMKVKIRFPFPTAQHTDGAMRFDRTDDHQSIVESETSDLKVIRHLLDGTAYTISITSEQSTVLDQKDAHYFVLAPEKSTDELVASVEFSPEIVPGTIPLFSESVQSSALAWKSFWQSGGAIDFSGSTDPRAHELERRIVLSQYLTRIQCAGAYPPQETGLTFNSWFGKFHLEMHWWHTVHFALWNRIDLMEKSLWWYAHIAERAAEKAKRQGYKGVRWPKMTDPDGNDSPSSIGEFLIWQQPHFIYFAELAYRHHQDRETLEKYADLVFATADFMASFPVYNKEKACYDLAPPLIPAQESLDKMSTFNPPFELAYWHWGLSTAQRWRERLGKEPDADWQKVIDKLPSLPQSDGLYLAAESAPDSYTERRYQTDHPMVLGAFGMMVPYNDFDTTIMRNTLSHILENWHWDETWGWDYPMTAMNATRLIEPEKAVDALLMNVQKNTYLANGHNYQDDRLRIYLPGNGGVLLAAAMMCAGFDGCTVENPGIPKNGQWKVRWENLSPMP